ncbi:MAG: hypothetical protein DME23_04785 [Verrucomicrobia bacterium]|nr:MAG: hypothetical protein DME23_04785 [Verrucomicrobiota bacterium]
MLFPTLLYSGVDQAGNRSTPHPALSPSDGERVAEGRVRGKRNVHFVAADVRRLTFQMWSAECGTGN